MVQEFDGQYREDFITIISFEVIAARVAEFPIGLDSDGRRLLRVQYLAPAQSTCSSLCFPTMLLNIPLVLLNEENFVNKWICFIK
jgi:hypothetical protein